MEIGSSQFGAVMDHVPEGFKILGVQREGVAYGAGLRAGDVILTANGATLSDFNERDGVRKIVDFYKRGVELKIKRKTDKVDKIYISRQKRKEPDVLTSSVVQNIAVIRLLGFDEGVADLMETAISDAFEKADGMLNGFVLDLRANPGGDLNEAIEILDLFLPKDLELVKMVGPHNSREFISKHSDLSRGLPVVVLQDTGSASASELVAGTLKSYDRATIIGEKSYGKDVAQSLIPLKNKQGVIILTTSRYFLPVNESVNGGLQSDIRIVENPNVEDDNQLKTALDFIRNRQMQNIEGALGS